MYIKPMTKRPAFQSDLLTSIAIQDDLKSSENKCNVSEPCLKEIQEDIKKDDEESSCVSSISRYLNESLK